MMLISWRALIHYLLVIHDYRTQRLVRHKAEEGEGWCQYNRELMKPLHRSHKNYLQFGLEFYAIVGNDKINSLLNFMLINLLHRYGMKLLSARQLIPLDGIKIRSDGIKRSNE